MGAENPVENASSSSNRVLIGSICLSVDPVGSVDQVGPARAGAGRVERYLYLQARNEGRHGFNAVQAAILVQNLENIVVKLETPVAPALKRLRTTLSQISERREAHAVVDQDAIVKLAERAADEIARHVHASDSALANETKAVLIRAVGKALKRQLIPNAREPRRYARLLKRNGERIVVVQTPHTEEAFIQLNEVERVLAAVKEMQSQLDTPSARRPAASVPTEPTPAARGNHPRW